MKEEGNIAINILLFIFILIIIIAILSAMGLSLWSIISLFKKFFGLYMMIGVVQLRAIALFLISLILIFSMFMMMSHATKNKFMPASVMQNQTNTENFYVVIQSSFPGQSQELSLPLNSTGYIMYPDWNFLFFSDEGNTSYQIY